MVDWSKTDVQRIAGPVPHRESRLGLLMLRRGHARGAKHSRRSDFATCDWNRAKDRKGREARPMPPAALGRRREPEPWIAWSTPRG